MSRASRAAASVCAESAVALAREELARREVEASEEGARRDRMGTGAMMVREAFASFMASRRPDPNNTRRRFDERGRAHQRAFTHHIEPHLGDVKLCDLAAPRVLRAWVAKLCATKTHRPGEKNDEGRTLSAGTIRKVVITLCQIAKAHDVAIVVPLAEPLRQKRRKSRPRALQSIEEVRALLAAIRPRDRWFRVACALACYAGLRRGEVASLRRSHIDWPDDLIRVSLSWEGPLKARTYEDNEEEAKRAVPLAAELAAELRAWFEAAGAGPDDRVVFVPGPDGARPLSEDGDDLAAKTRSACRRAGLTPLKFHELRATYATLAANQGLPVSQLQTLLGHAQASTTAIYIRSEARHAAKDPRAMLGGNKMATPPSESESLPN